MNRLQIGLVCLLLSFLSFKISPSLHIQARSNALEAVIFPDIVPAGFRSIEPGPSGVTVAPDGRVYVAVYQDNRVYSWATVLAMLNGDAPDMTFGDGNTDPDNPGCDQGPTATRMCGPESVAVDSKGNLFVADTYNHRVLVFHNPDADATPLVADAVLGQPNLTSNLTDYNSDLGDGVMEGFCFVRGVAVDADDNLWVVDEFNHRVVRFDTPLVSGSFPSKVFGQVNLDANPPGCTFVPSGNSSASQFNMPLGVAVDAPGAVYVTDIDFNILGNNRVQRFAPGAANGAAAEASYTGVNQPHDVAVDGKGNLYVSDTLNSQVLVYAGGPGGDLVPDHIFPARNFPMGMAFTATGDLLVADCGAPLENTTYPPCLRGARGVYFFKAVEEQPPDDIDLTLHVDVAAARKPISPFIYGMNEYGAQDDDVTLLEELKLPLRRWGGNLTSRYNWQNDISNHASDWFFNNNKQSNALDLPDDSAVNRFINDNRTANADSFLVLPLTGYVSNDNPQACGFSVAKYGPQQATAAADGRPDCGNGIRPDGSMITDNDPLDTSIAVGPTYVADWVSYLVARYGRADAGGVRFYNYDNEPDLWFQTHRDVRPIGYKYAEIRDLTYQYGAAIKTADPSAALLGPAVHGWTYYWHSAYDGQREDWVDPNDRNEHGGTPFVAWYLQQMQAYEAANDVRILDYLDLHYYPQAPGVALGSAGDAAVQARRLRSTRSLWDATYVDESWIADAGPDGGIVRLIPRMREWIDDNYPGTQLAIGEYNWGGLEHINGALAQADVLGIFGREGMDFATLWQPPRLNQPGAFAFRIYRNYDTEGGKFGDTSVAAISSNQDLLSIYAAQRNTDGALTLVIINKSGTEQNAQLTLANFNVGGSAQLYRYAETNLTEIVRGDDLSIGDSRLVAAYPANSITLLVLPHGSEEEEEEEEVEEDEKFWLGLPMLAR